MRNSAHYFTFEDALCNLENCLDYFKKSGTKFDQATVLNNIGVIHVWNKNYGEARKLLNLSSKLHQSISSNEIFEVYCNLSVLEFLDGKVKESLENANKAIAAVPQSLTLDHIILKMNEIIFKCALGQITVNTAYEEFLVIYNNSIINKDPWVRFQVVYNLCGFEDYLHLSHTEQPNDYYITKYEQNHLTCFEVLSKLKHDSFTISVSLSLSPNWRY
jgi:tetratricopeptide (TPR) repeat protein